jgi:hypothetical protein
MPTLIASAGWKICIYADHAPPHFHIRVGEEFNVRAEIATLDTLDPVPRKASRAVREALAWARANRESLVAEWMRINEKEPT